MTEPCTCAHIDGFRIRARGCPRHNECLATCGPVPKLHGATFVCVLPAGHDMPHSAPDGTWWEPAAASTPATKADVYPRVQGRCPTCGSRSLFLGAGGYVTCSWIKCSRPDHASDVLDGESA